SPGAQRHLHSFPTRRSSDLTGSAHTELICSGGSSRAHTTGRARGRLFRVVAFAHRPYSLQPGGGRTGMSSSRVRVLVVDDSALIDRKSTCLNSSHVSSSYAA